MAFLTEKSTFQVFIAVEKAKHKAGTFPEMKEAIAEFCNQSVLCSIQESALLSTWVKYGKLKKNSGMKKGGYSWLNHRH